MLSHHIEGRVLDLVQRVINGARVEDLRVECKAVWPEARRVARQLAGHANMARGEPILWIIGVDEDRHQVTGASDVELADWWAQVIAALDQGIAPDLTPLVVPVGADQNVVALYMTTERTPYVVKRQSDKGQFEREVLWRDGNRTRSAHRHELLRLLVGATSPPEVTVVKLELRALHRQSEPEAPGYRRPALPERIELNLWGTVFFRTAWFVGGRLPCASDDGPGRFRSCSAWRRRPPVGADHGRIPAADHLASRCTYHAARGGAHRAPSVRSRCATWRCLCDRSRDNTAKLG
jgi:hypothetical protein